MPCDAVWFFRRVLGPLVFLYVKQKPAICRFPLKGHSFKVRYQSPSAEYKQIVVKLSLQNDNMTYAEVLLYFCTNFEFIFSSINI